MSTRSRIGVEVPGSSIISIYVHHDGYYSHHAPLLLNHYVTLLSVLDLMQLGDLSSLGETPKECVAYGRDRGEKDTHAQTSFTEGDFKEFFEEYNYLYRNGKWWTTQKRDGQWIDLALAEVTERLST
jgi:hypothetical protein